MKSMRRLSYHPIAALAATWVCLSGCGQNRSQSSALESVPTSKLSIANVETLVGIHTMVSSRGDCPEKLKIELETENGRTTLNALGIDSNGKPETGVFEKFYDIGGSGIYTFNSSNSQWTYLKTVKKQESLVLMVAQSLFVKPLSIFAKEKSRLKVSGNQLIFSGKAFSDVEGGLAAFECTFEKK